MKNRIKGNSVRLRLSKSEVERFGLTGVIEETTIFPEQSLTYRLVRSPGAVELNASFADNIITVAVPSVIADDWVNTGLVGFDSRHTALPRDPFGASRQTDNNDTLYILVEK